MLFLRRRANIIPALVQHLVSAAFPLLSHVLCLWASFVICLLYLFPNKLHAFTWYWFNLYSAGIDFSRQNLTSTDVRFWWLKSIPAL